MASRMAVATTSMRTPRPVAVVGEGHRGVIPGPAAELQWAPDAGERRGLRRQVVAPEADVVQVGVLVALPHRPGQLLDELQPGLFDRVAEGGGQDDVPAGAVAVLDLVEVSTGPQVTPSCSENSARAAARSGTTMPTW